MASQRVFAGDYFIEGTLGHGGASKVKLGVHRQTGQRAAVKIVRKAVLEENTDARQRVEREIKVLKLLNHPNIMQLYDVMQTPSHLFVVMEHLEGGELYDVVANQPLTDATAFRYFYQLITGVAYMHSQNICHRDLKLENLLLDADGNLKIADFGMASAMPRNRYLETSCGSPHYACPEIVKNEKYLGTAADAWSCGVILYALNTSSLPFDSPNVEALCDKIVVGKYFTPPQLPSAVKDCLAKLLKVRSGERMTLDALQSHPYWLDNLRHLT